VVEAKDIILLILLGAGAYYMFRAKPEEEKPPEEKWTPPPPPSPPILKAPPIELPKTPPIELKPPELPPIVKSPIIEVPVQPLPVRPQPTTPPKPPIVTGEPKAYLSFDPVTKYVVVKLAPPFEGYSFIVEKAYVTLELPQAYPCDRITEAMKSTWKYNTNTLVTTTEWREFVREQIRRCEAVGVPLSIYPQLTVRVSAQMTVRVFELGKTYLDASTVEFTVSPKEV